MAHRQVIALVDQPAAGADWSTTPANGQRVRLQSITAQLATSATVANRGVQLKVTDQSGNVIARDRATASLVAASIGLYDFRSDAPSAGASTAGGVIVGTCPGFWLPSGAIVSSDTAGIDATDQWSLIVATFLVCDETWLRRIEQAAYEADQAG